MMAEPLVRVRVDRAGSEATAWAEGLEFNVPQQLADAMAGQPVAWGDRLTLDPTATRPAAAAAVALRERAAFTDNPPLSARTPLSYQKVPGRLRAVAASVVGRWKRRQIDQWARFPGWPLDLSADLLHDLASERKPSRSGPCPVIVSHDLDSPEGLDNLVTSFLPLEEAAGARSTNFVVPCAWPLDHGRLREVTARGHELGVHGYDHANRTPFAQPAERARRLDAARDLIDGFAITGYRAPSLLRTRALLRDLASRYRYDSSVPTAGGLFPVPNSGCATARPFVLEGIAEIPVTLPRDGSLRFLGYAADEIAALWIDLARVIARSGGVVMLLTHCEARFSGTPAMLAAYRQFLEFVATSPDFAWGRPLDIVHELGR
jgi:peptidoglycan/xylan/chitin deacetylase (PgdA/CDA1 family)